MTYNVFGGMLNPAQQLTDCQLAQVAWELHIDLTVSDSSRKHQ